jgi:4-carboxymuconolactone decarboxylase
LLLSLAAGAQEPLPADVDPDSRSRLPYLGPDAPTGVAGIVAHGTGALVRWEFALGRALSELAVLTTAREHNQPYEWNLHETEALQVGLEPNVIDIVRDRRPLTGISDREAIIIQTGREIFGEREFSAETYARAEALLGTANLVDIVMLMGEYAEDAVRLTAVNQYMPPGWAQFLPLPFTMPDDIYPDSRSRLPYLRRERRPETDTPSLYGRQLAPEGTGPGQIMRRSRGVDALTASVGPRLVRLANLIAARELESQYQWTMNALTAAESGIDSTVVDAIRERRPVDGLAEDDAALIEFGRELLTDHNVAPATYARMLELFGENDLIDFVNVMARSASDAALLIAFQQHLPEGQEPLL